MIPDRLFDQTIDLVSANLDRRSVSNRLISRNLANVDTPHYKGTGLEFEKQLRDALEGGILPPTVQRTHQNHLPTTSTAAFGNASPEYKETGPVHLDIEMSKLAENNIMFNAMIQLLNKKYTLLKTAIADGGAGK